MDDDEIAEDCDGHGTHVASTLIGRHVGVAKKASIVSLRVLDCDGNGSISTTVAGLDWIAKYSQKPSIVTMSLGVSIGKWSTALEDSVNNLIENGITVIVASGNYAMDSCLMAPSNIPETITVAASDLENKFSSSYTFNHEYIYEWSNYGNCIDIFAPGVDIYGACGTPSIHFNSNIFFTF